MPDDDRVRSTVRLPPEAYDALCKELPSFSTDTARFQFLVQFYLDYKRQIRAPGNQPEDRPWPHGQSNTSAHGKNPPAHEQSAENQFETETTDDNSPANSTPDSQD
jgi:hypothetical protein